MSAIFGEILTFDQANDQEIQLRVTGDEFYATYETIDGYTAVSDSDRGYFCYAILVNSTLVSSGIPANGPPPAGLLRHLRESLLVRNRRFEKRRLRKSRWFFTATGFLVWVSALPISLFSSSNPASIFHLGS